MSIKLFDQSHTLHKTWQYHEHGNKSSGYTNGGATLPEHVLPSQQACCPIMLAHNLLLSFIGDSVSLLPTVSKVYKTLYTMWRNFLLSISYRMGNTSLFPHILTVWIYTHMQCDAVQWTRHTAYKHRFTQSDGGGTVHSCPSRTAFLSLICHTRNMATERHPWRKYIN
jgi:hypothetical protein